MHIDDILTPDIEVVKYPSTPGAEAYRTLNTNILFSTLDLKVKTLVITSSGPEEGKTTIASNLSCVMAEAGHKTVIMDCDLRCPKLHRAFLVSNTKGITNIMLGEISLKDAIQKTQVDNLYIITSGMAAKNPAAIIASSKMKNLIDSLKSDFEYIIIDTPPVISVTDAQILASYSDGCIIVAAYGKTEKQALKKTKDLLSNVKANILGVVLNKVNVSKNNYYYYYNYKKGSDFKRLIYKIKNQVHIRLNNIILIYRRNVK